MKTKISATVMVLALTMLLPNAAVAQLKLTGARLFGIGTDGKRSGNYWNTVGNDGGFNVYLFTGTPKSPKFLNSGNTDDSLNPKFDLTPGTYTLGFAADTQPTTDFELELCFNDDTTICLSVRARDGGNGQFSGTTTYSVNGYTVTLIGLQTFSPHVDLVSPYENKPNGVTDFAGSFTLRVTRKSVPRKEVTLNNFKLTGDLTGEVASFTLTANAVVEDPKGGSLELLAGPVALTSIGAHANWSLDAGANSVVATFERSGNFPVQIKFDAAVQKHDDLNSVDFHVASAALLPVVLQGLPADTQFNFTDAARPDRTGTNFSSYLPVSGEVKFSWKQARTEASGKLFYAAEMLSQITVSPGLMRQVALLNGKVMQGEMNRVVLLLRGSGEVTRVLGDQVLSWSIEPGTNADDRRLVVQFNQPQKETFAVQVQMQTPLGAFPQTADAMQLRPENATRFAGYFRIVNEGAVRLEVAQASGCSQVSPDQFPEDETTKAALRSTGDQKFAYRFSSPDFALRIQADQILPEVGVSQVLAYNLGENELAIDAEIELDVRDAPLRELLLNVPRGYAIARINVAGLSDYFLRDLPDGTAAELRLVYGQPVLGRQVVQLRLERNQSPGETNWTLPRVEVAKAKSVRGFIGVSADAGFRLTTDRSQSLTEIATAFFPGKAVGLQAAFRLSDPNWDATMRVERLPQTVQADAFHLFSIGEGVAYGSSVINYNISGAPMSGFRLELPDEYFNVEFTGKDIRSWQKTTNGYVVQLHSPVSGAYTLLATYERPFKSQGETLTFTGARAADAQSEQGHAIVISSYQFQVKPAAVSSGLLALESGEIPAEYRLFYDAPVLAAYRYSSRPFDLKLALSPLAQGDSLNQVVDRASLATRVSKEGQVLTDVRYFVKSRGNPNFRLTLADGTDLWSATVNEQAVVPVRDGKAVLIPLPQRAAPDAVLTVDLKLASRSTDAKRVAIAAPVVDAPVLLAEWKLQPDEGQRLVFNAGSLSPVGGTPDDSGFAQLMRLLGRRGAYGALGITAVLFVIGLLLWRWAGDQNAGRFSQRHIAGSLFGFAAIALATVRLINLAGAALDDAGGLPRELTFLAPVQQAASALTVEVGNVSADTSSLWRMMPAMLLGVFALVMFAFTYLAGGRGTKSFAKVCGWTLLAWAALRWTNGAPAFLAVVGAYLLFCLVIPALKQLWRVPEKTVIAVTGVAPHAAMLIGLLMLGVTLSQAAPVADSVTQQIRIEDKFALATVKIHWQAEKGQLLPLLSEPAVMTHISFPKSLKLEQAVMGSKRSQQLVALAGGTFDIEVQYQLQVTKRENDTGFVLPVQSGLINEVVLTLSDLDVDVNSPQAISAQRRAVGTNTVASLVLSPASDTWVGWTPRSRDVKREKAVFYVETTQLYAPSAGVIEGAHNFFIRPAQGELSELVFTVPAGVTITDVADASQSETRKANPLVSLWRFDPDARKLRVTLTGARSKPFNVLIRSQMAVTPLPFEKPVGLISMDGAAGQIGLLGVATGNEVQLDNVNADNFSPINLEDFPANLVKKMTGQIPGLTVRRAFRYSDLAAVASVKASAVEPDVRVETQDTLSLGEDRTVLATTAAVTITRAGIFRLSFVLPANFDVEAISGAALSHWTEMKTSEGRVITLNLSGKTEGEQQFTISLAGPGVKATNGWSVPQLTLREATKQRGTLLIVPEQGMRLQVGARDGVTQLDPQKSGIKQKGVLAFHVLQAPWNLALDVEQVDPWIQVTSLQQASVNEAQVKIAANLQYQIENTGVKSFRVLLPTNAESVSFKGDQVADFRPTEGANDSGPNREWEIKLQRRVIGPYLLQVAYQTPVAENSAETVLRGVQALDVNLQRGFVTVQSSGRLQVRADNADSSGLQTAEWQSIPRALQAGDLAQMQPANFTFRLVEADFKLPLKLERHDAAKLLPARVRNVAFTSVISDTGTMLTQVHLEMEPGDARPLHLKLPHDAKFWFAFVNKNGVWPSRQEDEILIPLAQPAHGDATIPVEFFFSSQIGTADARSLDLKLIAPQFDLPLEDITWRVFLNDKWQVRTPVGTMQLQQQELVSGTTVDLQSYLQDEAGQQQEKTKEAEQMFALGNSALLNGEPQQARRAFQSAYELSANDMAFNEDARVQLNNVKLQQALVGLNVRQSAVAGEPAGLSGKFRNNPDANYTQQDAQQIIDRNNADDNVALTRLASRLIQQQDAAAPNPAVIRANIPQQGKLLTFKRAVVVDTWADLNIGLRATAAKAASWSARLLVLCVTALVLAVFGVMARTFGRPEGHASS